MQTQILCEIEATRSQSQAAEPEPVMGRGKRVKISRSSINFCIYSLDSISTVFPGCPRGFAVRLNLDLVIIGYVTQGGPVRFYYTSLE